MVPIDKDGFPSIIKYNHNQPPRNLPWTKGEMKYLAILIILSPLILSFVLTMLCIVLPFSSLRKKYYGYRDTDDVWISEHLGKNVKSGIPNGKDKREMRRWIVKSLSNFDVSFI
jgi:hypothetical protein